MTVLDLYTSRVNKLANMAGKFSGGIDDRVKITFPKANIKETIQIVVYFPQNESTNTIAQS